MALVPKFWFSIALDRTLGGPEAKSSEGAPPDEMVGAYVTADTWPPRPTDGGVWNGSSLIDGFGASEVLAWSPATRRELERAERQYRYEHTTQREFAQGIG